MATFDAATLLKLEDLRTLRQAGTVLQVFELVRVDWPSPDGTIHYATTQIDAVASALPEDVDVIDVRLIPEDPVNSFLPVSLDNSIGDEELDLNMWDNDEVISNLLVTHGEGIKAELLYFFPQVDLLLPIWHGHLRFEDEASIDTIMLKAVQGFRSSDANVPSRAHWQECQAIFGGVLTSLDAVAEHDCPYDFHLGGSVGNNNPDTGLPWTYCDRRDTSSCTARGVDPRFHLSHKTIIAVTQDNQTHGPNILVTSAANETNLKTPVRVIMGKRRIRGCEVMAWFITFPNNHPDDGFFHALYEVCEGSIKSLSQVRVTVGGFEQPVISMHYVPRLGAKGQSAAYLPLTSHTYSGTALFRYTFGQLDPRGLGPGDASGSALVEGLDNIRVYTDAETYTLEYTSNRAWQIARILTDKRWGFGLDYDRLDIDSFIEAAAWCEQTVEYIDPFGTAWAHIRSDSNVELIEKKVQQQIEDMCVAGRLSRPFLFNGKYHIVPLRALTEEELDDCPVFTDEGDDRNIIWEGEPGKQKTTLTVGRDSSINLVNRIECTYDYVGNDNLETPLQPVEDIDAQLAAGRVIGDGARKITPKKYSLLGVVAKNQAIKMAWSLLDLGPCDDGGLQNNCRVKMQIWFADALQLHQEKVIKVVSSRLTKYGFTYFRVKKINRLDNLHYEIELRAYNETYMATFETDIAPPDPHDCVPGYVWDPVLLACVPVEIYPPCLLVFGAVTYEDGVLTIPLPPCD